MIQVRVNGEAREVPPDLSVDGLLRHLELRPQLVVVEHNGEILRRDSYVRTNVDPGDSFELVHFVGGG